MRSWSAAARIVARRAQTVGKWENGGAPRGSCHRGGASLRPRFIGLHGEAGSHCIRSGSTSSSTEENVRFWIDEASKTILLGDGTPLSVRRFDNLWISADHADMRYELDRQNGSLTFASATFKNGTSTVTLGSGRCRIANAPGRVGPASRPSAELKQRGIEPKELSRVQ